MIKTYGWLITIIASLLAAAIGGFILMDERLVRVEERSKHVIELLEIIKKDLRQHEDETKKP